jgi:hypothetical protein
MRRYLSRYLTLKSPYFYPPEERVMVYRPADTDFLLQQIRYAHGAWYDFQRFIWPPHGEDSQKARLWLLERAPIRESINKRREERGEAPLPEPR